MTPHRRCQTPQPTREPQPWEGSGGGGGHAAQRTWVGPPMGEAGLEAIPDSPTARGLTGTRPGTATAIKDGELGRLPPAPRPAGPLRLQHRPTPPLASSRMCKLQRKSFTTTHEARLLSGHTLS